MRNISSKISFLNAEYQIQKDNGGCLQLYHMNKEDCQICCTKINHFWVRSRRRLVGIMFVYVSPNVLIYEQLYHCYYMQYQQSIVFKNTNRVTLTCALHMMTLEFTVIGINGLRRSHHHTITVGYSNKPLAYYYFWISTKFWLFQFQWNWIYSEEGESSIRMKN